MRANEAELALVVDEHQQVRGLLSAQRLYEQLFTGALVRFRK
jgi:CBS domain containing-hemolysin-like protein